MARKIKAIKCPQCGSTKQRKIDEEHFECINCGSGYILDTDDITINHNYNYTNTRTASTNKKTLSLIFAAIAFFVLMIAVLSGIFSSPNTGEGNIGLVKKITWQSETVAQAFMNKENATKLLIIGQIGSKANRSNNQENGKLYWSVYNISTEKTEMLNVFEDISENITPRDLVVASFNDGYIYFVFKKTKVYRYNIAENALVYLNDELENKIEKLKSGIGSMEINRSYNCLDLTSNTGAKISYYPSTNLQVLPTKNIQTLPNALLETQYIASNSNPSHLIRYESLQQVGYPIYTKPSFHITFDENEEPVSATVSDIEHKKAFITNYSIVPTTRRMHKLIVLGSNSKNVAIAYKENIQEGEKYTIELLDSTGNAKWNLKTKMSFVSAEGNLLSDKGDLVVHTNNVYILMSKTGKIEKTINLDHIALNPNE